MSAPRKRKTKRQAAAANAAAVLFCPRSRAQPIAAGGPVPVSQIAATIAADGGGRTRSRGPNRRDDHSRWRRADPFPWAKSPRRSQPMATTALAPPIRLPFRQFLTERTLRRRALALPLPASIPGCLLRKERCGGRRLRPCAKDGAPVPGEKSTFPFTKLPTKMKKDAPLGRKTYLITRHPPRTIKNRTPVCAKNAAPLCRTAVIKNKKTGRPIWTSCKFGCGNNLTSRGVIPKYFRRWRA